MLARQKPWLETERLELEDAIKSIEDFISKEKAKYFIKNTNNKYLQYIKNIRLSLAALLEISHLVHKQGVYKLDSQGNPLIIKTELQFHDKLDDPIMSSISGGIATQAKQMLLTSENLFKQGVGNQLITHLINLGIGLFTKHRNAKTDYTLSVYKDYYSKTIEDKQDEHIVIDVLQNQIVEDNNVFKDVHQSLDVLQRRVTYSTVQKVGISAGIFCGVAFTVLGAGAVIGLGFLAALGLYLGVGLIILGAISLGFSSAQGKQALNEIQQQIEIKHIDDMLPKYRKLKINVEEVVSEQIEVKEGNYSPRYFQVEPNKEITKVENNFASRLSK